MKYADKNEFIKEEEVPLLNFEVGPGIPILNFEEGPGILLLNFRGVPGPTFKLWGGSQGSEVRGPGILVPLLHHAKSAKVGKRFRKSKCSCLDMKMMLTD